MLKFDFQLMINERENSRCEPEWEAAPRTHVSRYLENDAVRYSETLCAITAELQDGNELTTEDVDRLLTSAFQHQCTVATALLPILVDDANPDPELLADTVELYHLHSQILWQRRSERLDVTPGLAAAVIAQLRDMTTVIENEFEDELQSSCHQPNNA